MHITTITLGGWYQRTTLHLTEVYDLFARGTSNLPLSRDRLLSYQQHLRLQSVTRQIGPFEYILATTHDQIIIHFYEDGLYTLTLKTADIESGVRLLKDYYALAFTPALNFIFSLGAPTPKILAQIKTHPPLVVSVTSPQPDKLGAKISTLSPVYSTTSSKSYTVYRTPNYIFVAAKKTVQNSDSLTENQIFFREFKDQLERYLNIHRQIWEEIDAIKEKDTIRGKDIPRLRDKLETIQKTIQLIESRLNQMGSYATARAALAKEQNVEDSLNQLFQYKFQTLNSTHSYIKELWRMTQNYSNSTQSMLTSLQADSTKDSITSLRLITTYGVIAGIIGYLSRDSWPSITTTGFLYFCLLIFLTWALNKAISLASAHWSYKTSSHMR